MAYFEMPVRSDLSAYEFQIELEKTLYTFYFQFNARQARWIMEIRDELDEVIITGIPILTNVLLTKRFKDARMPLGDFFVFDSKGADADPDETQFGTRFKLIYRESTT
jgi:hypothetical protein